MIVFPAIDILGGRCVRLLYGDFKSVTDYGDPVETALKFEAAGAKYLHVVDLDGAKGAGNDNAATIKQLINAVKIPVETGGGIRTIEKARSLIDNVGAERVVLGTALVKNPAMVDELLKLYGSEAIVCGIDFKDNKVLLSGWADATNITPLDMGFKMRAKGIKYALCTDVSRDGALVGVNAAACAELERKTGLKIIASGGVGSTDDIKKLRELNVYGVVLGKALYSGAVKLETVLSLSK